MSFCCKHEEGHPSQVLRGGQGMQVADRLCLSMPRALHQWRDREFTSTRGRPSQAISACHQTSPMMLTCPSTDSRALVPCRYSAMARKSSQSAAQRRSMWWMSGQGTTPSSRYQPFPQCQQPLIMLSTVKERDVTVAFAWPLNSTAGFNINVSAGGNVVV